MSSVVPDPALNDWVPMWNLGNNVPAAQPSTRVYRSTAQSIPHATWTRITFDTVRYDSGGQWAAGTPTRLTCNVTGSYAISVNAAFAGGTGGTIRLAGIAVNGVQAWPLLGGTQDYTRTAGATMMNSTTVLQLNAGDYVELQIYQDSGAALNTQASGSSASNMFGCELSMALVGGMQGPAGSPRITTSSITTPPPNPQDGDIWNAINCAFSGVTPGSSYGYAPSWQFVYSSAGHPSLTTAKWLYLGGSAFIQPLVTTQWSALNAWTPLAGVVPPRGGLYTHRPSYHVANAGTAGSGYVFYIGSGVNNAVVSGAGTQHQNGTWWQLMTGADVQLNVPAGQYMQVMYYSNVASTANSVVVGATITPVAII